MITWWSGLTPLNQLFWVLVVFFTTLFVWQIVASFTGLVAEGGADADGDVDLGGDLADGDGSAPADLDGDADGDLTEDTSGLFTFRLLSLRSALAFLTLFSWAAALYLGNDISYWRAFLLAALWGLAGMVAVAAFFWALPRLAEEGTMDVSRAVGETATVYVTVPREGTGQVRVLVGDRVSYLRARSASGRALKPGTPVRVVRVDGAVLEVEEAL
jgi:membrane protein implicated in regulation of membrane protease activity